MDNNYELESRTTSATRPALALSAVVAADLPTKTPAPAKDQHAMPRGGGPDFTPIVTHYVFLVTFVLAIVSNILGCAVAHALVELTEFS